VIHTFYREWFTATSKQHLLLALCVRLDNQSADSTTWTGF